MSLKELLKDYNQTDVDVFIAYVNKLATDKDKNKKLKNPWMAYMRTEKLSVMFKKVVGEGLKFDGKHITLQVNGISYDYIAYKNKMLIAYPETKMQFSEIYEGDKYLFKDENGSVTYTHTFKNPFEKDLKKVIGLYCVIKNKRGEFFTFLNKEEIEKRRKVAKTDYIWKAWELEMMYKTIIKSACKIHFDDIFIGLDEEDNKSIDLEKPIDIDLKIKQEIEKINTREDLTVYYKENKDNQKANMKSFNKMLAQRAAEIDANKKGEDDDNS